MSEWRELLIEVSAMVTPGIGVISLSGVAQRKSATSSNRVGVLALLLRSEMATIRKHAQALYYSSRLLAC